jgi:predicted CopG family antitoxin
MSTVMFMAKKTTLTLRDDVYQTLKETSGARNISNSVNKILIEYFAKKETMFGTMKKTSLADLRDHKDRCQ